MTTETKTYNLETEQKRMTRARTKLVMADRPDYAFLSGLCALPMVIDEKIPTACTDGSCVRWNPAYTATLSDTALLGLLVEELLHVGLLHVVTMRDCEDHRRANIAADMAIMEILEHIKLDVPEECCKAGREPFQDAPKNKSMEFYYHWLGDNQDKQDKAPSSGSEIAPAGSNAGSGGSDGSDENAGVVAGSKFGDASDPSSVIAGLKAFVKGCADEARGTGPMTAELSDAITAATRPRVDYRKTLRKFRTSLTRGGADWSRPDKRLRAVGVNAPRRKRRQIGEILVLVDCSGSMGDRVISQVVAELGEIFRSTNATLHVWQHDVRVIDKAEWKGSGKPPEFHRRTHGGTDHRPAFRELEESSIRPKLVICMTDCETRYPDKFRKCPVFWLADRPVPQAWKPPFGTVLDIVL